MPPYSGSHEPRENEKKNPPKLLLRGVKSGHLIPHEIMDHPLVKRIGDGLQKSPHTTPKILRFYALTA